MNARAMLLSIVTGLGHVYLGYHALGAFLFSLFAFAMNGVFLGHVIVSNPALAHTLLVVSIPAAATIWVVGILHAYRISYGTNRDRLKAERARLFREALVAYLRDDLHAASRALEETVERDVDWEDPDALFHLGVVELRKAEIAFVKGEKRTAHRLRKRALRAFRTCLSRDRRKKWRGEIALEREKALGSSVAPPISALMSTASDDGAPSPLALGIDDSHTTRRARSRDKGKGAPS